MGNDLEHSVHTHQFITCTRAGAVAMGGPKMQSLCMVRKRF